MVEQMLTYIIWFLWELAENLSTRYIIQCTLLGLILGIVLAISFEK